MTPALKADVKVLWGTANDDPAAWNVTCAALASLAGESEDEDPLRIVVASQSDRENSALRINKRILAALILGGFILDFDGRWGGISFRFRDKYTLRILTKAGNLLELYTCLAADFADDRDVGVPLDWDGQIQPWGVIDTRNEADVMLTIGTTAVCISCKNGLCDKDNLYELETVANHFGGRFSRKILVAIYVHNNENSRASILQRAADMGITLIPDVEKLTMEALSEKLREAVKDLLLEAQ